MINQFMRTTLRDSAEFCLACTRNSLALVGFSALLAIAIVLGRAPLTVFEETPLTATLPGNESAGFVTRLPRSADGFAQSAAADPQFSLDREGRREINVASKGLNLSAQAGITRYLSRKYHLSAEAIGLMVKEADTTGRENGLDPMLLLAVIGIESGFNPFAESGVGAQGLMQVMSKIHRDKFDEFGGARAALDPVANIKIGAFILKDCIRRGGTLRDGLRLYVGSTTEDDGGYSVKVFQERDRIQLAARGGDPLLVPAVAVPAKVLPPAAVAAKSAQAHEDPLPRADASPAAPARDRMAAL